MSTDSVFSPESVLAAAFADHDFIGQIDGQEVSIATRELFTDEAGAVIEVDAMTNPIEDEVTYRYRIVFEGVVADQDRLPLDTPSAR